MIKSCRLFLCLIMVLSALRSSGQESQGITISGTYNNRWIVEFLADIKEEYKIDIFFKQEWFETAVINGTFNQKPLEDIINESLSGTGVQCFFYNSSSLVFVLSKEKAENIAVSSATSRLIIIGNKVDNPYSNPVNLAGLITDGKDGLPIIGATIYSIDTQKGAVTDENGKFNFSLPTGRHRIKVTSISYSDELFSVDLRSDGDLELEIFENLTELETVVITAKATDSNVRDVIGGTAQMDIVSIKTLPTFLGEIDVVKSLITLPGVSTVGEGSSVYNVRGGTGGENLILQDGVMLFNSSHLFGFFSAFNPDLVNNVTLYKGSMPAEVGGRVSSVLDVSLKDKRSADLVVKAGVSLVSSRLAVETRINESISVFAAGRISYVDWLLKRAQNKDVRNSTAGFGDVNAKIIVDLSNKDKLTFSGYHSGDRFSLGNDTTYRWQSSTLSAHWNHSFSEKFYSNLLVYTGVYKIGVDNEAGQNSFNYKSTIAYNTADIKFEYLLNGRHVIKFGAAGIFYNFNQGELVPGEASTNIQYQEVQNERAIEASAFAADEWLISPALKASFGLRLGTFTNFGPQDVFVYDPNKPRSVFSIIDTIKYEPNSAVANYLGLEPRASLRYTIRPNMSIKVGYSRNQQFLHLISNSISVTPVDVWQPSNYHIKPLLSHQYSIGYFQNLKNNTFETSIEFYYKETSNYLDYKGGAALQLNETLEADLLSGSARSYGAEVLFKKIKGNFTGWVGYTLSRSEAKVIGDYPEETINNGNYYLTNYDKPHDLTIVLNYRVNKRLSFSTNFSYYTGRPITIPVSQYRVNPLNYVLDYSNRNTYRIPDYHRLDFAMTVGQSLKKSARVKTEFVFGIYNLYGRKNPYSVYFDQSGNAYQLSILGSIFPSISYNIVFK